MELSIVLAIATPVSSSKLSEIPVSTGLSAEASGLSRKCQREVDSSF